MGRVMAADPWGQLVEALKFMARGRSVAKARWQLHKVLKERGWTVKLNQVERQADGTYARRMVAALEVSWPLSMAIEVGKSRPGRKNLERLANTPGQKVLVLIWSRGYKPWLDNRSEWHRVQLDELEHITVVAAGGKEVLLHTHESLGQDYEAHLVEMELEATAAQRAAERERARVAQLVLEVTRQAWLDKEPLSCHGNVEPHRHLPTVLGADPELVKSVCKQLVKDGQLVKAKHPYTLLSGLKTTDS